MSVPSWRRPPDRASPKLSRTWHVGWVCIGKIGLLESIISRLACWVADAGWATALLALTTSIGPAESAFVVTHVRSGATIAQQTMAPMRPRDLDRLFGMAAPFGSLTIRPRSGTLPALHHRCQARRQSARRS